MASSGQSHLRRVGRLKKQQTEEVECVFLICNGRHGRNGNSASRNELRLCVCMFGLGCALVPRSSEGHGSFLTALNLLS